MDLKEYWALARQAVSAWIDDYVPSMGAARSYYTLFSIAPLLLIVIAVAGMAFGDQAARGEIFAQLNGLLGPEGAAAVEKLLQHADQNDGQGLIAAVTGMLVLLLGATTVFGELQNALDRIWRAPQAKQSGLWKLLRSRGLSFGMILVIAFLLMVSLVLSAVLSALGKLWGSAFGAAGSLVVLMVWVYYSAQIFLLGAEFTRVYAHAHGSRAGQRRRADLESASATTIAP